MALTNKIDFVMLISARMANPNGDPLNGNRPRTTYSGYGQISDVCIKRKIRNRMQDLGNAIFVQSQDRADDGCESLADRAKKSLGAYSSNEDFADKACKKWMDVRAFGQVFAIKKDAKGSGVSIGVRGPVSIQQALSCTPIDINSMQITKSVNGESGDKKSSDTMGTKHLVEFGLYEIKGSINTQLAEKTGFNDDDAEVVKECLRTLFENDASAARPEGSMRVVKLYWYTHKNGEVKHSSADIHDLVKVSLKDGSKVPSSIDDYNITAGEIDGVTLEVVEGF